MENNQDQNQEYNPIEMNKSFYQIAPQRMWAWKPKEDITVYELAEALPRLLHGGLTPAVMNDEKNQKWTRHFEEHK